MWQLVPTLGPTYPSWTFSGAHLGGLLKWQSGNSGLNFEDACRLGPGRLSQRPPAECWQLIPTVLPMTND